MTLCGHALVLFGLRSSPLGLSSRNAVMALSLAPDGISAGWCTATPPRIRALR
jgi:hypothetical protein